MSECPIEFCPNECGFTMHRCKLSEHDKYTCPEALVPCCNASFGCDEILKRKHLTSHIEHCPASIVMCSFSYDRNELKFIGENSDSCTQTFDREDDATLFLDDKVLQGDLQIRKLRRISVNSGENGAERTSFTDTDVKERRGLNSSTEPLIPPPLSLDCTTGMITNVSSRLPKGIRNRALVPRERTCIDTTESVRLHYTYKPPTIKYCCTFCCNELVRRDEFATHWKSLHLDLQLDMPEIVTRCPLYNYGCRHGQTKMVPNPDGSTIDYDIESDSFLRKIPTTIAEEVDNLSPTETQSSSDYASKIQMKQELALYGYGDEDEESYDVLGQLPTEVLMSICMFLDSQSLWYLSQVNHYLRTVCSYVVKRKGVVYFNWEHDKVTNTWSCGPKVRMFVRGLPLAHRYACLDV